MSEEASSGKAKVTYGTFGKILYNIVGLIHGYDEQTLSVCMRAFEISLKLKPSSLSTLATIELMSMLGCSLFWGYLADRYKTNYILGTAMFISGMACILLGGASEYPLIIFLRILHGFSLACTSPASNKIITDSFNKDSTSAPFGIFQAMNCIGRLASAMISTYLSTTLYLGNYGWRLCYTFLGYVWILFGTLVAFFVNGTESSPSSSGSGSESGSGNGGILGAFKGTFTKKSAKIMVFVIYISDAPFGAFVYVTMYLQYLGLSNLMAGLCCACTLIGGAIGSGAGGIVFQKIHNKWENHGRFIAAIVVLIIRGLFTLLFFLGPVPKDGKPAWYSFLEMAVLGATLLTVGAVDNSTITDIVDEGKKALHSSIYRCIAGISSSITYVPLCGFLSNKVFGYIPSSDPSEVMEEHVKATNAYALRMSIIYIIMVATVINICCYIALCFTYKGDKASKDKGK